MIKQLEIFNTESTRIGYINTDGTVRDGEGNVLGYISINDGKVTDGQKQTIGFARGVRGWTGSHATIFSACLTNKTNQLIRKTIDAINTKLAHQQSIIILCCVDCLLHFISFYNCYVSRVHQEVIFGHCHPGYWQPAACLRNCRPTRVIRRYAAGMLMVGFKGDSVTDDCSGPLCRDLKVGAIVLFNDDLTGRPP